mmetsp:Transcript_10717/g.23043  ORF Transcript_10717/g.23043 Transcript_10717/m.23043 type:complete len:80 (+) Transcript_10717:358-597(+)
MQLRNIPSSQVYIACRHQLRPAVLYCHEDLYCKADLYCRSCTHAQLYCQAALPVPASAPPYLAFLGAEECGLKSVRFHT